MLPDRPPPKLNLAIEKPEKGFFSEAFKLSLSVMLVTAAPALLVLRCDSTADAGSSEPVAVAPKPTSGAHRMRRDRYPAPSAPAPDTSSPHTEWVHEDPAISLIGRLVRGDFSLRRDLTTGRLLEDFAATAYRFDDIDLREIGLVHRGHDWILLEAPYKPAGEPDGIARVRLICRGGVWRIEDLKVRYPSRDKLGEEES